MTLVEILVLSVIQGITEFLPVSSQGHLILLVHLLEWRDHGRAVEIAAHVGTLAAVMVYFRRDVATMAAGAVGLVHGRRNAETHLALMVAVASVPVIAAGAAVAFALGGELRSVAVIAWAMLGFGVVLYVVDQRSPRTRDVAGMSLRDAALIGLAQVLALIPGTSRAGITVTAARLLGIERREAARFSMLLGMPTIAAAGVLGAADLAANGASVPLGDLALVALLSCAGALGAIWALMRWLERASFTPLVIYRVILGAVLLAMVYT